MTASLRAAMVFCALRCSCRLRRRGAPGRHRHAAGASAEQGARRHGRRGQMDRRRTRLLGDWLADRRAGNIAWQTYPLQRVRRRRGEESRRLYFAPAGARPKTAGECAERMARRGRCGARLGQARRCRQAQAAANRGLLVVASYHNHHDDRPATSPSCARATRPRNKLPPKGPM